jgi:hypothetical protein
MGAYPQGVSGLCTIIDVIEHRFCWMVGCAISELTVYSKWKSWSAEAALINDLDHTILSHLRWLTSDPWQVYP